MDMKPFVDSIFDFFMNNDIGQTSKSVWILCYLFMLTTIVLTL
jgi:hypothetical protein